MLYIICTTEITYIQRDKKTLAFWAGDLDYLPWLFFKRKEEGKRDRKKEHNIFQNMYDRESFWKKPIKRKDVKTARVQLLQRTS